jgi:hypothetical protein
MSHGKSSVVQRNGDRRVIYAEKLDSTFLSSTMRPDALQLLLASVVHVNPVQITIA